MYLAQEVAGATNRSLSPRAEAAHQIHEKAKAGCLRTLTADHRAKVLNIIAGFDNGTVTYEAAASAIGRLLNSDEVSAIQSQELSMIESVHAMEHPEHPQPSVNPPPINQGPPFTPEQAGGFLVRILGNPEAVSSAMRTVLPMPSATPH